MGSVLRNKTWAVLAATVLLASLWLYGIGMKERGEADHSPLQIKKERSPVSAQADPQFGAPPDALREPIRPDEAHEGMGDPSSGSPIPETMAASHLDPTRTPAEWKTEFADVPWEELLEQAEEITEFITEQTGEELDRRMNAGTFVVISMDGTVSGLATGDDRLITGLDRVMTHQNGEVRRFQIPRSQYPDLYALADKADWMRMTAVRLKYARGH